MTRRTEALIITAVVAFAVVSALLIENEQRFSGEVRG